MSNNSCNLTIVLSFIFFRYLSFMTFSKLSGIFANELMTMINNIRSKFQCLFFSDKYFAQKNMNSSSLKCKASDCILNPLSKFFKSTTTYLQILVRKNQR